MEAHAPRQFAGAFARKWPEHQPLKQERCQPMPTERPRPVVSEMQVVTRATTTAAALLGIKDGTLAEILGLQEASIQRMQRLDHLLEKGSEPFEKALLLIGLFRNLHSASAGEEETARSWLASHNHGLGAIPADMILTSTGLVDVLSHLAACGTGKGGTGYACGSVAAERQKRLSEC